MGLFGNSKEIENVYANGKKIDRVFANSKLIWESTIYVEKPTVTGEYTYNTAAQSAVITGYDEAAMTISGTLSATEAGTYHVYFTLNKGYAWKDESTAQLDYTWTIAKKSVSVPKLSATSFSWVEGATHSVVVSGIDTTYISQSGNLSQTDTASNLNVANTVTWSLKNTKSVTWTDGTTGDKSASWKAIWTNGTSHYKTDLYNSGWNSGRLKAGGHSMGTVTIDWGGYAQPYIVATGPTSGYAIYLYCPEKHAGKTFHAIIKTSGQSVNVCSVKYTDNSARAECEETSGYYKGTTWGELYGRDNAEGTYFGGLYGLATSAPGNKSLYVQRAWID
jgi:hypothetical protein